MAEIKENGASPRDGTDQNFDQFIISTTNTSITRKCGRMLFHAGAWVGKTSFFVAKELIRNAPSIAAGIAEQNLKQNGHQMSEEQREKAENCVRDNKGRKSF